MFVCMYVCLYIYLIVSQAYHVVPKLSVTAVGNGEVRHGQPRALVIFVRTVATWQRHFLQPFGFSPIIFSVGLVLSFFPPFLCLRSASFPSQYIHENRWTWHLPLTKKVWAVWLDQKHVVCLPGARATHITFVHVLQGWPAMPFQQI